MLDLRKRDTIPVEWEIFEPNFDGKVFIRRILMGTVVDSWTVGPAYYLLVLTLDGRLHKLESGQVTVTIK